MPVQLISANGTPFRGIKASKKAATLTPAKQDIITSRNQAKSPFFRLPSELRNITYEYALTERERLHYRFGENKVPRLFSKPEPAPKENGPHFTREANQLKYVCRQLRYESKGYGLKFNSLNFTQGIKQSLF